MAFSEKVIYLSEHHSTSLLFYKNKKRLTHDRTFIFCISYGCTDDVSAIGGLTWSKARFPTDADDLLAVVRSLKNVVFIACPGSAGHALAYNGIFYSTG